MAGNTDIFSPDFDAQGLVNTAIANGEKVEQDTVWQKLHDKQEADSYGMFGSAEGAEGAGAWLAKLPKNLTVGATNAALAMVGLLHDTKTALDNRAAKRDQARADAGEKTQYPEELRNKLAGERPYIVPDSVRLPVMAWRDEVTRNNAVSDDLTQGIAQFVLPFTMFSKMANVSSANSWLMNAGKLMAAEAETVATAYEPHDARGADLLELGRQAENKFGEVMRAVSPDGSLLNAYIDYMTDREDEGPWEGRYKNVVDSLGLTAATAGLLKAVPFSLKAGRYAIENAGTGPTFGSKAAQGGWIDPGAPAPTRNVFRGVEPGVDPVTPRNRAGALFYTPKQAEAESYGAITHKAELPKNVYDAGSLPDFLQSQGVNPKRAGKQDALMEALSNYADKPDAAEWLRFTYPIDGTPEEFVRFPAKAETKGKK